ncbi:xylulokinase [Anoxybacillus sp. B7M1]|jgi:xylulokinase|uniref:xylulokinase n=1 Tax=unclassified Anoxybacillus TaxID=2639704 RepID=UPI0005CD0047|nr:MULTISPECIES: xylulokinase [unclassified Anoxybacillus]ANB58195.1 xylulokinase [Anoxybacillus sp. B2M1]ANB64753.1 xylulokinase [Anoxybacillus sp. B7M1]
MEYVIGIDLGTSAVKVLLIDRNGQVRGEWTEPYPLYQPQSGYSEQNPEDWVEKTMVALRQVVQTANIDPRSVCGLSFSGQMHGLVLLNEKGEALRKAILWNDTRTANECREIEERVGVDRLLSITQNRALEGFTLPKILWVKKHEPQLYQQAYTFLLPKDYVRFRLTGQMAMEYSDAAGTLLLDIRKKAWSREICELLDIDERLCPPLVESTSYVGTLLSDIAEQIGLSANVKVFAGGADNACGAIGAGILSEGTTMCSIGTSGVVLAYEQTATKDFAGKVHYFNHAKPNSYYIMGVTLAAGYSFDWLKRTFMPEISFSEVIHQAAESPIGANGLLFTPYLVGERTPHADAHIRASFIGIDASHTKWDFARAVMEGIIFSLNESVEIIKRSGKKMKSIVSIGGGAKSHEWLQIQANIFHTPIEKLKNEQGPGLGAAMIAACGCGWFESLEECAATFKQVEQLVEPQEDEAQRYQELFHVYRQIYAQTKEINEQLKKFRK